ncbi:RING membrane-anchor 1 [Hibiscus trionum]|uniref:E3 ubiquitin-protein ligase RMA n=1 Tax=Hibiscus trionum TaxID=183268 RepID=A0A9W7HLU3_HIBTR|nr:RING membrane-anchor 1 [Hibiscus trionum]
MAMEQCLEKWRDSPVSDDNPTRGFDCNICLDSVQDPVVTLCGHLYCWPCIYKWLHFDTISAENQDRNQHQCPVCKAEVSVATLIPLYGRGVTTKKPRAETPRFGIDIPKRPLGPTCGIGAIQRSPNSTNSMQFHHHGYSYQPQVYYPEPNGYPASPMLNPGGMTINVPDPLIRMFGEMVYARVFGDSVTNFYTYPDSYNLAGITSPRIRRHIMQADKSLGRISFFLFCCVFLCLLLF